MTLPRRRPRLTDSSLPRAKGGHLPYSLLIVDDNALIRQTLRTYLEAKTDWLVCGESENGKSAVDKVQELKPDVVILDFRMPVMNGLDAARRIVESAPKTMIIMLTMHDCIQLRDEARVAGVMDVISKCGKFGDHILTSLKSFEQTNSLSPVSPVSQRYAPACGGRATF